MTTWSRDLILNPLLDRDTIPPLANFEVFFIIFVALLATIILAALAALGSK